MNPINKILAPTDLSESSQLGVRYALNLAKAVGAEVTVYHVADWSYPAERDDASRERPPVDKAFDRYERLRKSRQLALARFLNSHFSDLIPWVKIREKVELGAPEKQIVEWAKTDGADLIVISVCRRSGSSGQFVGRIAAEVVRNADCPVLSVRPKPQATEEQELTATG